jgi:hypothetical protein
MVHSGNPPHRNKTGPAPHSASPHHRMVTLAASASGRSTTRTHEIKNATVMLGSVENQDSQIDRILIQASFSGGLNGSHGFD